MVYIVRNNQSFGPYDETMLLSYVNSGQILLQDKAKDTSTGEENTVSYFLKKSGLKHKIPHDGNLFVQLKKIGTELIVPKNAFSRKHWIADKRMLILALVGLLPLFLMYFIGTGFFMFYVVSIYFASVWGVFFYYFFKTSQITLKKTILLFSLTQGFVFLAWDLLGIVSVNPFYLLLESAFPLNLLGFVFGVGLMEELVKALPLLIIYKLSKEPLIPQTLVFYGLISGIAFGVYEGVQYQMGVNAELDYGSAFFMNIARLTSLPFLHAVWCGIAGYFISFAKLYPKYRMSLYFLAIAIPAVLHGVYDTFCGSMLVLLISLPITFIGVVLLMTYLKQGVNYQSKLRN